MLNFFAHHSLIQGDYNLSQIEVIDQIGRGNSHVYNAIIKDKNYALKQIEVKSDYEYQNFLKQISLMKELSELTTYMVQYIGYFVTIMEINQYVKQKYAYIIMECAQTNLQNFITQQRINSKLSKEQILLILDFLIKAFAELEQKNVAHCDIKPENILITNSSKIHIKLCDVGSCKVISKETKEQATIYGTVPFLAPELIKTNSQKIISSNPFKSDVYSFGLVILYVITQKKFTAKERLQVDAQTYFQVISEWIRQAKELTLYDSRIGQVLKFSLQFDEFKRPLFKQVKKIFQKQKKKKKQALNEKFKKVKQEEDSYIKKYQEDSERVSYETTPVNNRLSLFKSRNLTKISTKTSGNGFMKKAKTPSMASPISTTIKVKRKNSGINSGLNSPLSRNGSPSPLSKRQSSCFSSSPQKINISILDFKKIIYITNEDKDYIPYEHLNQEQMIFVLLTPSVSFKKAEVVSILQTCSLGVVYEMAEVEEGKKLYVEYEGIDGIQLDDDAPIIKFPKIYLNLSKTRFGGYRNIFRVFCPINIQVLEINITRSDANIEEVYGILDRLSERQYLKSFTLYWEDNILLPEEHFKLTEKISKLSKLKKLKLIMNLNFIKYDKQTRWVLPKQLQILYLEYEHNFLGKALSSLSISFTKCNLKQLYVNLQNNNLTKSQINFLIKTISSIKTLQKLILNISMNPIEDINYITSVLINLENITSLQIKLYKTGVSFEKVCEAMSDLKYLFDKKLRIFKLGYDRKMKKNEFVFQLGNCLEEMKSLVLNVIGYDNKYFMAFIKKRDKPSKSSKQIKSNRVKGQKTNHLGFKVIEEKETKHKSGQCSCFYTNHQSYENYLCLSCCQIRQLSKTQFFCKYCIENCEHKGHNIVKIYQKTSCYCAYGPKCCTDVAKKICAQKLNIKYKTKYECYKCERNYCFGCVQRCFQMHKKWVQENKEFCHFECGTPF